VGRGATRRWPAGGGRCKRGKLSRGGTINTRDESRAPRVCAGRRGGRAPNYGTDLAVETRGAGGRAVASVRRSPGDACSAECLTTTSADPPETGDESSDVDAPRRAARSSPFSTRSSGCGLKTRAVEWSRQIWCSRCC
jgi:hypothetical protein